jgi:hypothetical protein
LCLLVALVGAARVHAQAELVALSWDAPADCPSAASVQARVATLAGTAKALGSPLQAAATITRDAQRQFHLRLVVRRAELTEERVLQARSCDDLAGAAAVSLALLLEAPSTPLPDAGADTERRASAAPAEARAATTPTESNAADGRPGTAAAESSPSGSENAEPNSLRWLVQGPRLAWAFGPLPAPSMGFALATGLSVEPWQILLGGSYWLRHTPDGARPGTGARVDRVQASVHVCHALLRGRFALAPCVSASLEHLRARGTGTYVRAVTVGATWVAAGVGLQARVGLTPWLKLLGSADLKLHAARPRIVIEGGGAVAELGWLAAELSLGGEWIL